MSMRSVLLGWSGFFLLACGGATSVRMADVPVGTGVEYGAPRDTAYSAEVDSALDTVKVTVFAQSQCDVIPVTIVQRYEERLHGDEVVQRNPTTKKQVAGKPVKRIPCEQGYVRNAEVFLAAGEARYSIGQTGALGDASARLAQVFQVSTMEEVPPVVSVEVRLERAKPSVKVGELALTELKRRNARLEELLTELRGILAKGETGASPAELTRGFEVYAQLQELGGADARVQGLSMRFWEVYLGRKQEESRQRLDANLKVLSEARESLKVMGDAAIPLYVQVAVSSGVLDQRTLEWSSLRLIRALRGTPAVCAAGFSFQAVSGYGWPADARLAAQVVQAGRGDAFAGALGAACQY